MNLDLEDDDDTDELAQMLARGQSDTAALLWMYGVLFVEDAESMKGDGMQGPYFQVQKSEDWFVCALNMPDHQSRAIFRCVLTRIYGISLTLFIRISRLTFDIFCEILGWNPLFMSHRRKPQCHIAWQLGAFLIRWMMCSELNPNNTLITQIQPKSFRNKRWGLRK
jgi:hypothetical protein